MNSFTHLIKIDHIAQFGVGGWGKPEILEKSGGGSWEPTNSSISLAKLLLALY